MNRNPHYILVTDIENYPACINADAFMSAIQYKRENGSMFTKLKYIKPGMTVPDELKVLDSPKAIYRKLMNS